MILGANGLSDVEVEAVTCPMHHCSLFLFVHWLIQALANFNTAAGVYSCGGGYGLMAGAEGARMFVLCWCLCLCRFDLFMEAQLG